MILSPALPSTGSSPLTRGKPQEMNQLADRGRLIPAHAGKTRTARRDACRAAAHPRSRGENGAGRCRDDDIRGSSPLTRGKRRLRSRRGGLPRLIPAHAGKTRRTRSRKSTPAAHPRSRGENTASTAAVATNRGSSPLTRGKPHPMGDVEGPLRLIPAHAGKTPPAPGAAGSSPAHPRSRGENDTRTATTASSTGSSPLTRGKPFR